MLQVFPSLFVSNPTATFDPNSVATLRYWYKADGLTGYNDGDGVTSLIASFGSTALPVFDGAKKPVYKVGIQNGLPVVRWTTGAPGWWFGADVTDVSQPDTIYVVGKQTTLPTAGRFIDSSSPRQLLGFNGSGFFDMHAGASLNDSTDHSGAFHTLCAVYNGASSFGYLNGTQVVTGNAGTNGYGFPHVGSDAGIDSMIGDWCEMLVYSGAHDSTARSIVLGYLKTKWGTP